MTKMTREQLDQLSKEAIVERLERLEAALITPLDQLVSRVIEAPNDPLSLTQPDDALDPLEMLRMYAQGIPIRTSPVGGYGNEDMNMDRAQLERLRVEAKDLEKAVKNEFEKNEREKVKREQQQQNSTNEPDTSKSSGGDDKSEDENEPVPVSETVVPPLQQKSPGSARKRGV